MQKHHSRKNLALKGKTKKILLERAVSANVLCKYTVSTTRTWTDRVQAPCFQVIDQRTRCLTLYLSRFASHTNIITHSAQSLRLKKETSNTREFRKSQNYVLLISFEVNHLLFGPKNCRVALSGRETTFQNFGFRPGGTKLFRFTIPRHAPAAG